MNGLIPLPGDLPAILGPYLPKSKDDGLPFVTLTYAQSLDSRISQGPGIRTMISHPETKTMTHFLRSHYEGILIGSGTAVADDPGLNCKYFPSESTGRDISPRPIIIDVNHKWRFHGSKMQSLFQANYAKPPIIVCSEPPKNPEIDVEYLVLSLNPNGKIDWTSLFKALYERYKIKSLMVEGGAYVINDLLIRNDIVDSLIITIGPRFLGKNGVEVSPPKIVDMKNITWWKGTSDTVLCAHMH